MNKLYHSFYVSAFKKALHKSAEWYDKRCENNKNNE